MGFNKKSQMEVIGLVIIVILIVIAVAFTFNYLLKPSVDVTQETQPKEIARGFMNTILQINMPGCKGGTWATIFRACVASEPMECKPMTGTAGTEMCGNLAMTNPCCFLQVETAKIADHFFKMRKWDKKYKFELLPSNQPNSEGDVVFAKTKQAGLVCTGERDLVDQPYPIPIPGQTNKKIVFRMSIFREDCVATPP